MITFPFKCNLALAGLSVFIVGISLAIGLRVLEPGPRYIERLVANVECIHPIADAYLDRTVLTEGESSTLTLHLRQGRISKSQCVVKVALFAPNFDYEPKVETREVTVPGSGKPVSIVWVLAPKKLGEQAVVITSGSDTAVIKANVVTSFGLTMKQTTILSYVAAFLGPVFTLPWWIERISRRRQSKLRPPGDDDA